MTGSALVSTEYGNEWQSLGVGMCLSLPLPSSPFFIALRNTLVSHSSSPFLHRLEEHPCFSLFLSFPSSLPGIPCFSSLLFPFLHHLKEHLCFHSVSFSLIILKIAWNRIKLLEIRSDGFFGGIGSLLSYPKQQEWEYHLHHDHKPG
jgi:hypothetical protein